jgi:hypothetical protein
VDLSYIVAVNSTNTAIIDDIAAGVVGFETPDAVVAAATGTAKYSGSGSMVLFNSKRLGNFRNFKQILPSILTPQQFQVQ